jgi:hypothetical protein
MHRDPDRKCPLRSHRSAQFVHFPPAEIELGAQAARTSLLRNADAPDTPTERNRKPKKAYRSQVSRLARARSISPPLSIVPGPSSVGEASNGKSLFCLVSLSPAPSPSFRLPEFFSIIRKTFRGLDVNCFSARERLIARMDEMEEIDGCDSCQIIREQM